MCARSVLLATFLLALSGCATQPRRQLEEGPLFAPDELAGEGADADRALDRAASDKSFCEGLRDGGQRFSPAELPEAEVASARAALLAAFACDGRQPLLVVPADAEAGRLFATTELGDEELRMRLAAARARLAGTPADSERRVLAEQLLFELGTKAASLPPPGQRIATELARRRGTPTTAAGADAPEPAAPASEPAAPAQ